MRKAFVFGKFLPFHKGHEALIDFAASKCDFLTVLICCSELELVPCPVRRKWLEDVYAGRDNIDIKVFAYDETVLPNTSISSAEVSKLWAAAFKDLFSGSDYGTVITSEPYGELVAGYMGIEHISFDRCRELYPISGSQIRKNVAGNWNWLPDTVKEDYIIKVVILGTESTGKTTLTNRLADHFRCSRVLEAGRELIKDSRAFTMDDLYLVAARHAEDITIASRGASPLLIIDTDIHITLSYGRWVFGRILEIDADIYRRNAANLYLYLNNDVEHVQDGTRLCKQERDLLDRSHRNTLSDQHIKFEEVTGDWEERFEKAVGLINHLIKIFPLFCAIGCII